MKTVLDKLQQNEKIFQFIKFVIVGGFTTVIHYEVYLALEYGISVNANIAFTIGYIISFIFNYFASTAFTFKTEASASNGIKFAGAHLINYFVQMILLNIFLAIGINQSFAPILVFPIAMIINFFMVRFALKK